MTVTPADRIAPGARAAPGPALPDADARARRMRAPLIMTVWVLLGFESVGGLVIFVARLAAGRSPGETLHVVGGLLLLLAYAIYQWRHWVRVEPVRARLDYGLGLLAAGAMILVNVTGLLLGLAWWRDRIAVPVAGEVTYTPLLSGIHNIACMLVLTFAAGHLGAVLFRDQRARARRESRRRPTD